MVKLAARPEENETQNPSCVTVQAYKLHALITHCARQNTHILRAHTRTITIPHTLPNTQSNSDGRRSKGGKIKPNNKRKKIHKIFRVVSYLCFPSRRECYCTLVIDLFGGVLTGSIFTSCPSKSEPLKVFMTSS